MAKLLLWMVVGLVLGALSWIAPATITGIFEPFDNALGFWLCQAILALSMLLIGLHQGTLSALSALVGAWAGMNAYAYVAGSSETRAWIVLLMFSSLSLLAFPMLCAVFGGAAHALSRRKRRRTDTPPLA